MSNLISANVLRLRQYRIFWMTLGGVFLVSLFSMWGTSRSVAEMAQLGLEQTVDKYFFSMASYMGLVYAAFISLFLGPELTDGAVRNKLIAGHTRTKVYLVDYLVCLGACLAIAIMWLLGSLPGLFWIGPFSMQPGMVTAYLFIVVGFTAAFAAVFVLVGLASDNKAITDETTGTFFRCRTVFGSNRRAYHSNEGFDGGIVPIHSVGVRAETAFGTR